MSVSELSGTNFYLNLLEADPAGTYSIYYASNLTDSPWLDVTQGISGQSDFTLTLPQPETGFFRAARTDTPVNNTANMTAYFLESIVSNNLATASVFAGPAAAMAVLIDDTNVADARFIPFNSTPYVLLGTNDGTYDVKFGFIGLDGQTNWTSTSITLDTTPPQLFITGPTNEIVTQPVIQLTGYSPERLSRIRYDISNDYGLETNQPVFVIDQFYDTNVWKLTTNTFQAFDIPVAGSNTITIRATDIAGNTTTLVTNFTLDYSSKTNPPIVRLDWPLNGGMLCGSNFICHGWISDSTATVVAQLVNTNGQTNVFNAAVGRDGTFWLGNLPLSGGSNDLSLTVRDAANNVTVTNLTISQSDDIGLGIDPVSAGQALVTGEIAVSDYTIWVNGSKATNNGDGTWVAQIVPIGVDGGAVEAMAIPDSDNGGNGSGIVDAADNPTSAQGRGNQVQSDAPSGIYISSFTENDQQYSYFAAETNGEYVVPAWSYWDYYSVNWVDGSSGSGTWTFHDNSGVTNNFTWPSSQWPQPLPEGAPTLREEHTSINEGGYQRNSDTRMKLATGGPSGSAQMNLWKISATATAYFPNYYFLWNNPPTLLAADSNAPIDAENITILGKTLDSSGNLYALLPDNTNVDVTPKIKGNPNYYTFNIPQPTEYSLVHTTRCTAPGDTNNARTTIGIGEVVDFSGMPDGTTWSVSGNGTVNSTTGSSTTFTAKHNPGNATVTATIDDVSISTTFSIIAPNSITPWQIIDAPPGISNPDGTVMGAKTIFSYIIDPTIVSFNNVSFRENTNPASINVTWPNGTNVTYTFNRLSWNLQCGDYGIDDTITTPGVPNQMIPISYLFNGTNYADCSFGNSWTDQYQNDSGTWVDFFTLTYVAHFEGNNKTSYVTYLDISGGPQGPY